MPAILEDVKKFKPTPIIELGSDERVSEHQQVRSALYNFGEKGIKDELFKLARLRRKADYDPFMDITPNEVADAVHHMDRIFSHLKFE